ncbi:hypothetical protein EON63_18300 [archaeon]|nr:MAG: hypothetical protein EON63_18300 [archaeon]
MRMCICMCVGVCAFVYVYGIVYVYVCVIGCVVMSMKSGYSLHPYTSYTGVPDVARLWKEYVLASPRTIASYPSVYDDERVCENYPSPSSEEIHTHTHTYTNTSDTTPSHSHTHTRNSTSYIEEIEEDVIITIQDMALVCVKFLEVMVYVAFILVCVVLVTQCCSKVQERQGYTTI